MIEEKSPFLQNGYAPWRSEGCFTNLEVVGEIPSDLNGVLLRNGPNPQFDPVGQYHWFKGDGMLHAVRISNGKASYDNRWVRTKRFEMEKTAGKPIFASALRRGDDHQKTVAGLDNTANTNIVSHNNLLLALNEANAPTQIQLQDLHTIGPFTYQGQIKQPLSAHPRYDFRRKELLTYSYMNPDSKLIYYRLDQSNQLISQKEINWPYPVMLHDFVNTENYVIFPLFPCVFNQAGSTFVWQGDKLNTLLIITDKEGNEITRIETDPGYAYHFGNAYEAGDNIIIDLVHAKRTALMPDENGVFPTSDQTLARAARWIINLKNNTITLKYHDTHCSEFPRFDERFNGYEYHHLYAAARSKHDALFDRITHYDLKANTKQEHLFDNDVPTEPVFVPRSEKEGDGYLLTVVYRSKEDRSDLVILDANNVADDPIATIKLANRVPFGFHGNFVACNL